jgi:hypothetical protein
MYYLQDIKAWDVGSSPICGSKINAGVVQRLSMLAFHVRDEGSIPFSRTIYNYWEKLWHSLGILTRPDWTGKKHKEESKLKMSESKKGTCSGEKNSQYGTCWITKEGINKKIKIDELDFYIENNWIKGRKLK